MKNLFLALITFISYSSIAQENYKIEIDGKTTEIELDKSYEIKIGDKTHNVKVSSKDTLVYKDEKISFKYLKDYKITTSNIEEGLKQLTLMTADGSGFVVQIYSNVNPKLLNEIMLDEVTKESVSYGYKLERKDYERTLPSKQKVKVSKAFLSYKDDINIYEVATLGTKDEGVLIMSMRMDNEKNSEGQKLIDLAWNTLKVN